MSMLTPISRQNKGMKLSDAETANRIRKAFEGASVISKDVLIRPGTREDEETEEIRDVLGGRPWELVTPEDVRALALAPPLMSDEALRYYSPGFMVACLLDETKVDTAPITIISYLARLDPDLWSPQQRNVIREWITRFQDCTIKEQAEAAFARLEAGS